MKRGTLSGGTISSPNRTQTWTLDSLGNFTGSSTNSSTQARTVDPSNEIQTISGGVATPAYDLAGNMTTTPEPGATGTGLTCVYDAWNRLVQVSSGSTILAQYQYDGLGREVAELTNFTGSAAGTVTYSYYSGQNAIQTRTGLPSTSGGGAGGEGGPSALPIQYEYVFSPLGVKTPLVRDTYSGSSIVPGGRLYYLTDANTNVTAVVGLTGRLWQVAERYLYDPYGAVTICSMYWTTTGTTSAVGNTLLYASMVLDPVTGLYYDEARWYSTATSGFISTDPAMADLNTYRYCGNMPMEAVDLSGVIGSRSFRLPENPLQQSRRPGHRLSTKSLRDGWQCSY